MLGCPVPHTIRLLAARSSGMLPLAGSTPPDAPDDLPFADPAPLRLLLKKSIPLQAVPCTIREYMALYQTILYSLASRILVQDTRRFDAYATTVIMGGGPLFQLRMNRGSSTNQTRFTARHIMRPKQNWPLPPSRRRLRQRAAAQQPVLM